MALSAVFPNTLLILFMTNSIRPLVVYARYSCSQASFPAVTGRATIDLITEDPGAHQHIAVLGVLIFADVRPTGSGDGVPMDSLIKTGVRIRRVNLSTFIISIAGVKVLGIGW